MTKRSRQDDLGVMLRRVVEETSLAMGLPPQVSGDLARNAEERLRLESAGLNIYVGKTDRTRRNEEIRLAFNGYNEEDLARRYGLTSRRVRQILKTD
jgi:Mor family transcriptional regulator